MEKPADTHHPVHPLIRRRWSPRAFGDRTVEVATLRSLFEAARWAASSANEQPWRFIVARREHEAAFARLADCLSSGNRTWAPQAPVLVLTVAATVFARNGGPNRTALYDLGLAVAQLTLEAVDRGLAVHQMAGFDRDRARATYGIPDAFEPVTMLAIGHAGSPDSLPDDLKARETAPRSRRLQPEFVFADGWEQPFP